MTARKYLLLICFITGFKRSSHTWKQKTVVLSSLNKLLLAEEHFSLQYFDYQLFFSSVVVMLSLIIRSGVSPPNSGRCSGNSTVNGLSLWHRFWSCTDSESWETVRKSPPPLSQTPTITACLVRSHSRCGKNNRNKEFRKRQCYAVIVVLTLINFEKGKWKGLVLAFELGTLGKWEMRRWQPPGFGDPRGVPLWGLGINVELHHLGEERSLRSRAWGRQQGENTVFRA